MTTPAYTLGALSIYEPLLAKEEFFTKLGKHGPTEEEPNGYEGGAIWLTMVDAIAYVMGHETPEVYGVYEVMLPGTILDCLGPRTPKGYHHLLKNALILRRVWPVDA